MKEAIRKSSVLIEALPYIKNFFKKTIVIKFGGSAIEDPKVRKTVLEDIVFMNFAGMNPVLVHGGGPRINEKLKNAGKESKFIGGLRVTDKETMHIVDEALMELNSNLVEEIKEVGANAFGLSGKENRLLIAGKSDLSHDVGYAGNILDVDTTVLDRLIEAKIIPVICPVAMGKDGERYNINADEAASRIAVSVGAEKLLMLTNVDGIMHDVNGEVSRFQSLSVEDTKFLTDKGVIKGGMIPKTNACIKALEGNVNKAHIVNAHLSHAMLLEIFTDEGIGTQIIKVGKRTGATENI